MGGIPPMVAGTCSCHFSWTIRKHRIGKEVTLLLQPGPIISHIRASNWDQVPKYLRTSQNLNRRHKERRGVTLKNMNNKEFIADLNIIFKT